MTLIRANAMRGAEKDLDSGLAMIRAAYNIIYQCSREDGEPLLNSIRAGTRLLRSVHMRLCEAIGDDDDSLNYDDAKTPTSLATSLKRINEMMHVAEVSVKAAALSPFLMDSRAVRQNAAVEQVRSAAMILGNLIEIIEDPCIY